MEKKKLYNQQINEIEKMEFSDENYRQILNLDKKEVAKSNPTVISVGSRVFENRVRFTAATISFVSLGLLILMAIIHEKILIDPLGKVATVIAFISFMGSLVGSILELSYYVEVGAETPDDRKVRHKLATIYYNLFDGFFSVGIAALILAILITFQREFLIFYNWLAK